MVDDGEYGCELWVSDGMFLGMWFVVDIVEGLVFLSLLGFYVELICVFFLVNDGLCGFEIWVFDWLLVGFGGIFCSGFESGDNLSWVVEVF